MDTKTNLFELQVDQRAQFLLRETSKWAKFLSIVGFVLCVVFVLIGIFFGRLFSSMGQQYNTTPSPVPAAMMGIMMTIIYVIIAIIYFFPCLFLFKFSTRMQIALRSNDQNLLTASLASLKSYFRFVGILTIIVVSFWVLALVLGGLGAVMSDKFIGS